MTSVEYNDVSEGVVRIEDDQGNVYKTLGEQGEIQCVGRGEADTNDIVDTEVGVDIPRATKSRQLLFASRIYDLVENAISKDQFFFVRNDTFFSRILLVKAISRRSISGVSRSTGAATVCGWLYSTVCTRTVLHRMDKASIWIQTTCLRTSSA